MPVWLTVVERQVSMKLLLVCIAHYASLCMYVGGLTKYSVCKNSDLYMYVCKCLC